MTEKEIYAMPLMTEDVKRARAQLHSALNEKGYIEGTNSKKSVSYLKLGKFMGDEPTLRFTTRPPLNDKDQKDLTNSVIDTIDIFVEGR